MLEIANQISGTSSAVRRAVSRIGLLAALASFTYIANVQAQPSKLVLTGSVESVQVHCVDDQPAAAIVAYLQFRNDGDEPLILTLPGGPLLQTNLHFADEGIAVGAKQVVPAVFPNFRTVQLVSSGNHSVNGYNRVEYFLRRLEGSPVPSLNVALIEPGRYHEFRHTLWPESGIGIEKAPEARPAPSKNAKAAKCSPDDYTATPEHPSFRVTFRLPINKHADGLLPRLRDRWRRSGILVMTDPGDVTYRSEPIVFESSSKH